MTQTHPEDYDELMFQIGSREDFYPIHAIRMAAGVAGACSVNKHARVTLVIGGYDEDPREIDEIPEAVEYTKWFVQALKEITQELPELYEDIKRRLTPDSLNWKEVH